MSTPESFIPPDTTTFDAPMGRSRIEHGPLPRFMRLYAYPAECWRKDPETWNRRQRWLYARSKQRFNMSERCKEINRVGMELLSAGRIATLYGMIVITDELKNDP